MLFQRTEIANETGRDDVDLDENLYSDGENSSFEGNVDLEGEREREREYLWIFILLDFCFKIWFFCMMRNFSKKQISVYQLS